MTITTRPANGLEVIAHSATIRKETEEATFVIFAKGGGKEGTVVISGLPKELRDMFRSGLNMLRKVEKNGKT